MSFSRMIGLPTGIIGFLLAKRQVDKNRLKQLKIRQRMKRSNEGEYEGTRYRHRAEDVKVDTWWTQRAPWFELLAGQLPLHSRVLWHILLTLQKKKKICKRNPQRTLSLVSLAFCCNISVKENQICATVASMLLHHVHIVDARCYFSV